MIGIAVGILAMLGILGSGSVIDTHHGVMHSNEARCGDCE
jgi:hypothetical protein